MINYGGIPEEYTLLLSASIVILPVPYDGTSTWIKGSDKGPDAILDASCNVELYDMDTDSEVYTQGIHTADPLIENSSPEKMTDSVYNKAKEYLEKDKFLVTIGGEHSVSIGLFRAFSEKFTNLTILQIDAHTDLRQEYEGSKFNHACAMSRAREFCPIVQVGIRSMDISEKPYIDYQKVFPAEKIHKRQVSTTDIINQLTENVYLTIDLDGFDPSVIPSTGTPEPGGLTWYEVIELISEVNKFRNIVGFDVVELCPNEYEKSSDFIAAKLIYKILSYKFSKNKK